MNAGSSDVATMMSVMCDSHMTMHVEMRCDDAQEECSSFLTCPLWLGS